ncbi:ROK family transcriptional regulator [Cohnella zeiphila]|uniref:ROK family transcriptional regulator n=1 Tax=Cohnella zeiphila TaxID=2761120 RepID=A0A7X0VWT6_9BACL|nr:ROK family transcriptional regulator [Cohnella zeiphila]MBB6732742.1 ROK family transcriptional regulator [Cohnella zeiphila]
MDSINNVGDQKGTKVSIIQALRMYGALSRIELTKMTGLSRATISVAIAELIQLNLVKETESRYTTGGRPATLLELCPNSIVVLGADYSNQIWTLGAFDLHGNLINKLTIPSNDSSPQVVVKTLTKHLNNFVDTLETKPIQLIGLGMPGLIDINRGVINSASDLGWCEVDISTMIQQETGWQTAVINRHRARGLSECRFGSGKDFSQVIYIGIGTGIAAGLLNDSQLVTGAIGGAGELGHITIDPDGPLCPCGNQGCLQQLSTGPAMEQEVRMLLRNGAQSSFLYPDVNYDLQLIKADKICSGADAGDELCMKVVHKAASYLGIAMANLVNILNPEAIILGGPIPTGNEYYLKIATHVMNQRAMSPLTANVVVKKSVYNEIGGALGAAIFALDKHMAYSLFKKELPIEESLSNDIIPT